MAEFKAGTREQVKNGQAQYVAGDIVAKDAINPVGGAATRTKSVTQITGRDSSGRVTSSKTILYVEKNGNWQPAASKRDGKWNYSDPDYPLMAGVADAELQKDLANPSSTINKTTNNGIKAELGKFLILAALVTSIIFFLFFRSFRATIISIFTVSIGVMWTLGIVGLLGYELTVLTAIIPPLIIVGSIFVF